MNHSRAAYWKKPGIETTQSTEVNRRVRAVVERCTSQPEREEPGDAMGSVAQVVPVAHLRPFHAEDQQHREARERHEVRVAIIGASHGRNRQQHGGDDHEVDEHLDEPEMPVVPAV